MARGVVALSEANLGVRPDACSRAEPTDEGIDTRLGTWVPFSQRAEVMSAGRGGRPFGQVEGQDWPTGLLGNLCDLAPGRLAVARPPSRRGEPPDSAAQANGARGIIEGKPCRRPSSIFGLTLGILWLFAYRIRPSDWLSPRRRHHHVAPEAKTALAPERAAEFSDPAGA